MKLSDINEFLQFERRVRIAFVGLLAFSLTFLLLPEFYPYFLSHSEETDFSETEIAAQAIIEHVASEEKNRKKSYSKKTATKSFNSNKSFSQRKESKVNNFSTSQLFEFDPNKASQSQLKDLGFSEKIIKTILNYRNKGGVFYKKEDFKKIYGITEADYLTLEPFISIEKTESKKKDIVSKPTVYTKKVRAKPIEIDINKATEEDWQTLRGIGPYYAKKIVNFREKLGGFSSIEQIGTTYGLKDSTFQIIKPFLVASPVSKKIKINTATWEQLKNHPYIKGKQAGIIEKYRQNHGAFSDFESFKKVVVFSNEELEQLRPYLDFSID